jgi:hypothetical protein
LAVADLAQGATILARDADGLAALFAKAGVVDDPDAFRIVQARSEERVQPINDRFMRPRGIGQEALEGAGIDATDSFGEIFGIAALGVLDEQAAQVAFGMLLHLLTAKQGGEVGVKGRKGGGNAVKSCVVHSAVCESSVTMHVA